MAEPVPVPVPVATEEQGPWTQFQTPISAQPPVTQAVPEDTGPWTHYQTPVSDQQSDEIPTPSPNAVALGEATAAISGMGKGAWDINKYRANDWKPVPDESAYGVQKYLNKQLKVPSSTGVRIPRGTVSLEDLGKATGIDTRTMQEVQAALAKAKGTTGTMEPIIEIVQGVPVQTGTRMVGGTPSIDLSPYVKVGELEKRAPALNDFLVKNYKPIEGIKKRVKAPAVLGVSAAEAQAAINRAKEGDTGRAALDVIGAIGAPVAASRFLPKKLRVLGGMAAAVAPMVEATAPEKKAAGGLMHLAGGGGKFGAAADIAQKAAHEYANQAPGRVTDFLQHHLKKFVVPTQSDRMGGVGGVSFSANSLALPEYKGIAWGSGNKPVASGVTNLAKDERFGGPENQIFVPLIGEQNQHKSNQIVFNKLSDMYYKNKDSATPELREKINQFMRSGGPDKDGIPTFVPFSGFDIADKDMVNLLGQSFENRGTIAQHAFGGERLGGKKAQIIPYQQMLDELSDPTVKGAPTFAVGPRAFSLTGEVHPEPRPDLNSAFPYLLHGEDYNTTFNPVANRLMFPDFQNQWRLDKGKADKVLKSGLPPEPGYYENTMGYKPKPESTERVYPRQEVTEKLLDDLYEAGHKAGGHIKFLDHLAGGGVPENIVKAYKLFKTKGGNMDELFPLFVNANKPVPLGEWVNAEVGPVAASGKVKSKLGELAYRPGWHAGDLPVATHIGGKSEPSLKAPDYRRPDEVWAEVEMPADVDWQEIANQRARLNKAGQPIASTAHITDQIPEGGFYRYKTSPNMQGNWLIGGGMKINKVLSDEEVQAINEAAGVADLPRFTPLPGKAEGGKISPLEMFLKSRGYKV